MKLNVNNIVEDIMNNTIQSYNGETIIFNEPEIKGENPEIEQKGL